MFPRMALLSVVNRLRARRPRKAIKPYLVLDGGIDCEKTGGPTKQVERRGAPNPVPLIPMQTCRIDQKDRFDAEAFAILGRQCETIGSVDRSVASRGCRSSVHVHAAFGCLVSQHPVKNASDPGAAHLPPHGADSSSLPHARKVGRCCNAKE